MFGPRCDAWLRQRTRKHKPRARHARGRSGVTLGARQRCHVNQKVRAQVLCGIPAGTTKRARPSSHWRPWLLRPPPHDEASTANAERGDMPHRNARDTISKHNASLGIRVVDLRATAATRATPPVRVTTRAAHRWVLPLSTHLDSFAAVLCDDIIGPRGVLADGVLGCLSCTCTTVSRRTVYTCTPPTHQCTASSAFFAGGQLRRLQGSHGAGQRSHLWQQAPTQLSETVFGCARHCGSTHPCRASCQASENVHVELGCSCLGWV